MHLLNCDELKQNIYYHCASKEFDFIDTSLNKESRINYCMQLFIFQEQLYRNNILSHFLYHNYFPIEAELENYRQKYFPNYPSRLSCIFTFDSIERTIAVNKIYKWNSPIKKVYPTDNCKIIKCDLAWITYFRSGEPLIEEFCNAYWQGKKLCDFFPEIKYSPVFEYLIEGKVNLSD